MRSPTSCTKPLEAGKRSKKKQRLRHEGEDRAGQREGAGRREGPRQVGLYPAGELKLATIDFVGPARKKVVGHSTRTWQTGATASGPSAVARKKGASSIGEIVAGSRHVVGGRYEELCPAEETDAGQGEDSQDVQAGDSDAIEGSNEEKRQGPRSVRPPQESGAPTKAEDARQMPTHAHTCRTVHGASDASQGEARYRSTDAPTRETRPRSCW